MVGHITYLSEESMHLKFGRRLQAMEKYGYEFQTEFEVESYLKYNGLNKFTQRFDANSYLYVTKAMDYFDLTQPTGSLAASFAGAATSSIWWSALPATGSIPAITASGW
jgi:homoserine O-acetyltransferase